MSDPCKNCKIDLAHCFRNRLLSIKYHAKHHNDEAIKKEIETMFKYLEEFETCQRRGD